MMPATMILVKRFLAGKDEIIIRFVKIVNRIVDLDVFGQNKQVYPEIGFLKDSCMKYFVLMTY